MDQRSKNINNKEERMKLSRNEERLSQIQKKKPTRHSHLIQTAVIIGGLLIWIGAIYAFFGELAPTMKEIKEVPSAPNPVKTEAPRRIRAPMEPLAREIVEAATPRVIIGYKEIRIPGRPLEECLGPTKELNEDVLRCRNGYTIKEPIYNK